MPENVLAEAWIAIKSLVEGYDKDLEQQITAPTEKVAKEGGEKFGDSFAKGMGAKLTVAAAAIALFAQKAFNDWDAGADAIRASTGAVGDDLKNLTDIMEDVASEGTKQSIREVGETVAALAQRAKVPQPVLKDLTEQIAALADITGGDASDSVTEILDLFGQWRVRTADMTDTLDFLFRASQRAGVPVSQIISTLNSSRRPLQLFNFNLEESVALIASIESKGGDAPRVLGALQQAFSRIADDVDDPVAAFQEYADKIDNASNRTKAMQIAIEAFGPRAGPVLAQNIREGTFSIDKMVQSLSEGSDTIVNTRDDTLDLTDKIKSLTQGMVAGLGGASQYIAAFATIAAGIAPAIKLVQEMNTTVKALSATMLGVGVLIAGGAMLGDLVDGWIGNKDGAEQATEATDEFVVALDQGKISIKEMREEVQAYNDQMKQILQSDAPEFVKKFAKESMRNADAIAQMAGASTNAKGEVEDLAEAHEVAADAAHEQRRAELELAGGFIGIAASAGRARDAENTLGEARSRVERLTRRGKEGTDKYREAIHDLRDAQLDSVESQLGLASAVADYVNERRQQEGGQVKTNELIREYGVRAGLTKGEIRTLRDNVLDLIKANNGVQDKVSTKFEQIGMGKALNDVRTLVDAIARIPEIVTTTLFTKKTTTATSGPPSQRNPDNNYGLTDYDPRTTNVIIDGRTVERQTTRRRLLLEGGDG